MKPPQYTNTLLCTFTALTLLANTHTAPAASITHTAGYTLHGDAVDDRFGIAVSGAGDINNDGYDDLIIGARLDDNNNGTDSGSARVVCGFDGSTLWSLQGDSAGDHFGTDVDGAGDVNNDGYADLIVGAFRADHNGTSSGSAYVFSGQTGTKLYQFDGGSGDRLGIAVSGAGDVDGDGYDDIIAGGDEYSSNRGRAHVFSGQDGSTIFTFTGDAPGDRLGNAVGAAGDVDDDGVPDLITGAYRDDNNGGDSGSARIFAGDDGSAMYTFSGDSSGDRFGFDVDGLGDVNGDGYGDVVVGAWHDDNNGSDSGSARVISGKDGTTLFTVNGDSAGDNFSRNAVAGVGDVNNDGTPDFIVGAWLDDNNGTWSGSARVFSGVDASTLYTFDGDAAEDFFGGSVGGAGDVNGDGIPDFIVGGFSGGENDGGYARVFVSQVPEPASAVLMGLGAFMLLPRRGCRRGRAVRTQSVDC